MNKHLKSTSSLTIWICMLIELKMGHWEFCCVQLYLIAFDTKYLVTIQNNLIQQNLFDSVLYIYILKVTFIVFMEHKTGTTINVKRLICTWITCMYRYVLFGKEVEKSLYNHKQMGLIMHGSADMLPILNVL